MLLCEPGQREILTAPWTPAERRAWRPPERMLPSVWAERHRVLRVDESARPGPWRNRNAPHLVGIMDAPVLLPGVQEIVVQKPAQAGVSEAIRNFLACQAMHDPGPALVILPDKEKGRQVVADRFVPLFTRTPSLAALGADSETTTKTSSTQVRLGNGFHLWLGYAGSPSSLATHPCRYVFADEINKYPPSSGGEADPVSLAEQRTKTFEEQRRIIATSTPTTAHGAITVRLRMCETVLRYWCPCPHCGVLMQLTFDTIRWDKPADEDDHQAAERIERENAACYECPHCAGRISERDKPGMAVRGFWASPEQIAAGAHVGVNVPMGSILLAGLPKNVRRLGMLFQSMPCAWVKSWELAAKWHRVRHLPLLLMDFLNSDCGAEFEEQTATTNRTVFSDKCRPELRVKTLPSWTLRVYASVDVQGDHLWLVIRAWGPRMRSRRIWHQRLAAPPDSPDGWDALWRICFETRYPFEDESRPARPCDLIAIDSRWRQHEVYGFVLRDPTRIIPTKGETRPQRLVVTDRQYNYTPPSRSGRGSYTVWYKGIDTGKAKDALLLTGGLIGATYQALDRRTGELTTHELWELNAEDDPVYARHLSAEHKVLERKGRALAVEVWKPKPGSDGLHNHLLDCEVISYAMAWMENLQLEDERVLERMAVPPAAPRPRLTTPDGRAFLATER